MKKIAGQRRARNAFGLDDGHIERVVKGFASRRRIQIMRLLHREPDLSLGEICERLDLTVKNASEHVRKMVLAGLVLKRRQGNQVRHKITERAQNAIAYIRTIS